MERTPLKHNTKKQRAEHALDTANGTSEVHAKNEHVKSTTESKAEHQPNRLTHERESHAQKAAHEALKLSETSTRAESKPTEKERAPSKETHTNADRQQAYDEIMLETREHLPATEKVFSTVIHQPIIEKVSDVTANTVARPNAILSGSIAAFFVVLAVYLIARHFGYPLSGSEALLVFIAGWLLGNLFDFFRAMARGNQA